MKRFGLAIFTTLVVLLLSSKINAQEQLPPVEPEQKYEATVLQIVEERQTEVAEGVTQPYQKVEVEITSGPMQGKKVTAQLGGVVVANDAQKLKAGDKILVSHIKNIDSTDQFYVADFIRRSSLYILVIAFFLAVVAVGGIKGLGSFAGLAVSFVVLIKYIIPQIAAGNNPVFVAVTGSAVIILTTLYLAHGFNRKTTAALLGTIASLIITAMLAYAFVNMSRLTGLGSEEAGFLSMFPGMQVNLQGILLGGIIIGALGVLDDITVSQSAAVFELQRANKELSFKELYARGLGIGKDHIASLVNTLVLAYAGASLPLLLLLTVSGGEPLELFLNREIIAGEIVRTLVGSLGLISAVPITTALAAAFTRLKH